ncbi:MAG: hypothetical protein ACUVTL_08145 [Thermoproteota archaeon]
MNFGRDRPDIFPRERRAFSSIMAIIMIAAITIAIVISGSYWIGGITSAFIRNEKIEIETIYVVKVWKTTW